ncbi:MAG: MASE1 domain-containing protein [Actinomycetota bacterium]
MATRQAGRDIAVYTSTLALFVGAHFVAERLALSSSVVAGNAAPAWLASGLAVAIVFRFGYRYLPAVAIGAFLANDLTPVPTIAVIGATLGSVAEATCATFLLRRLAFRPALDRLRDVAALVPLTAVVGAAVSATLGVSTLWLGDALGGEPVGWVWLLWWFANATSILIVAPLVMMVFDPGSRRWRQRPSGRASLAAFWLSVAAFIAACAVVFLIPRVPELFIFPFIVFPFAILLALRYGPVGAVIANAILSGFAIIGTFGGTGPFGIMAPAVGETRAQGLLVAQVFVVTVAITTLALAAAVSERSSVRDQLRDAELRYRTLVEQIPAATYVDVVDDPETRSLSTLYVSPQVETMLGYRPEEFLEDPDLWHRIIHPDDHEATMVADREHYRTGEPLSHEARMIAKDGHVVWVRDEAALMSGYAGYEFVSQGVFLDITELMEAQAERARLRGQLVLAQEEERRRIAADIHDDPLQRMTAVGLRLETLRRKVPPETGDTVDTLEKAVEEAIGRLRHLMFELRPPTLDTDGLAAAIQAYVEKETTGAGFELELRNRLAEEPNPVLRAILYRIAQEALHNVVKHAGAERVAVTVEHKDGGIDLRIEDDGRGFGGPGGGGPEHTGLDAIRERATMAGGWAKIESEPGRGTSVEAWVPV